MKSFAAAAAAAAAYGVNINWWWGCASGGLSNGAGVVGTGRRGDRIKGAPRGPPPGPGGVRKGVASPGIGDIKRWASAAAAAAANAILRHSSSAVKKETKRNWIS